jgi:hypothetical protein
LVGQLYDDDGDPDRKNREPPGRNAALRCAGFEESPDTGVNEPDAGGVAARDAGAEAAHGDTDASLTRDASSEPHTDGAAHDAQEETEL